MTEKNIQDLTEQLKNHLLSLVEKDKKEIIAYQLKIQNLQKQEQEWMSKERYLEQEFNKERDQYEEKIISIEKLTKQQGENIKKLEAEKKSLQIDLQKVYHHLLPRYIAPMMQVCGQCSAGNMRR